MQLIEAIKYYQAGTFSVRSTPPSLGRSILLIDGLEDIAETFGKTVRSIRSKLVREGVYVATPKGPAVKADGPSKKELLRELESKGFDTEGFEGATKIALSRLLGVLSN